MLFTAKPTRSYIHAHIHTHTHINMSCHIKSYSNKVIKIFSFFLEIVRMIKVSWVSTYESSLLTYRAIRAISRGYLEGLLGFISTIVGISIRT